MVGLLSPIPWRQDSSLHDLLWVPKGRTVTNQRRKSNETTWGKIKGTSCCCPVAKSCLTLCNLVNCSTARLPCPSPSSRVSSNSCPLNQWCHPISSPPFPPALNFSQHHSLFQWVFTSGGQSIGISASVLPMNTQGGFPLGLAGLISLLS